MLRKGMILCNLRYTSSMQRLAAFAHVAALVSVLAAAPLAGAQTTTNEAKDRMTIRAIAEVETKTVVNGREVTKLAPADRLVPGDRVIYTLEIRNTSIMALPPPSIEYAVPEHTRYIADSASGPGADITYSIDGGHSYDRTENLKVPGEQGAKRVAAAEEYTHIRWQLKNILKGGAVAFARFRVVVK